MNWTWRTLSHSRPGGGVAAGGRPLRGKAAGRRRVVGVRPGPPRRLASGRGTGAVWTSSWARTRSDGRARRSAARITKSSAGRQWAGREQTGGTSWRRSERGTLRRAMCTTTILRAPRATTSSRRVVGREPARRRSAGTANACSGTDSGNLRPEDHLPVGAVDLSIRVVPRAPERRNGPAVVHGDAESMKAGRGLAVEPDSGFMKRVPGSALARLERLDARGLKASDDFGDPGIDIPVTALRRISGHGKFQTHRSVPIRDRHGCGAGRRCGRRPKSRQSVASSR